MSAANLAYNDECILDESMLDKNIHYDNPLYVRPRHHGLRSKWADTLYISHKARELYKKAQARKILAPPPAMPHFGHIPETMPPEALLMSTDSRTVHATDISSMTTKTDKKAHKASTIPPAKRAKTSDMWQVPPWLAALYPIYSASSQGKGNISVQGISYETNEIWDTYLHSVGKHYRNTLIANHIHNIKEHYQALMADARKSAAMKKDFYGRITADKALQKIMKKLGIRLESA